MQAKNVIKTSSAKIMRSIFRFLILLRAFVITDFLKKADDEYLNNLIAVDNEVLYSKVLDTDNPLQIEMPILPLSMMNLENGEIEYDEVERFWFNRKRILDYFNTNDWQSVHSITVGLAS